MPSNFNFLAEKFPELADDGRKAEKYLYADNEVCMFFISRIFDNVVKYLCSVNGVNNDGIRLAEPINDLFQKNAIDEGVYLLLEMMRTFRNGNAHNKDYSLNESMILLQMSHVLCEWLMESYGKTGYTRKGFTMPQDPAKPQPPAKPAAMSDDAFINLCMTATAQRVKNAITNGANVNATNSKGRTALMLATLKNHHPDVIELLIDSGADVNAKSKKGVNALGYAHHNPYLEENTRAFARLKSLTKPDPPKPLTPTEKFLKLCISGTGAEIAAAIKLGANVNAAYSDGVTALMTAARSNNADAVNVLLTSGANVYAKDKAGHTAAYWAGTNPKLKGTKIIKHL